MQMPRPASGPAASGAPASATSEVANDDADAAPPSVAGSAGKRTVAAMLTLAETTVRRHGLASALIAAGLVMRLLVQVAYQPAIVYIDTLKYLYDAWPGSDPVGYKVPLKMILAFGGSLSTVELIQHLLGIAIAITLYVV